MTSTIIGYFKLNSSEAALDIFVTERETESKVMLLQSVREEFREIVSLKDIDQKLVSFDIWSQNNFKYIKVSGREMYFK